MVAIISGVISNYVMLWSLNSLEMYVSTVLRHKQKKKKNTVVRLEAIGIVE